MEKLFNYTKEDFINAEYIGEFKIDCNSIVAIQEKKEHDSGFSCMSFVLLDDDNNIIGKIGGDGDGLVLSPGNYTINYLPCGLVRLVGTKKR